MILKHLLALCGVVAVFPSYLLATGYAPMIEEGKVWQYAGQYSRNVNGYGDGGIAYHSMKFDGTITVNGKEYHRFTFFESEYYKGTHEYGVLELAEVLERTGPNYFLREENGKVYVLTLDNKMFSTETLDATLDPSVPEERYSEFLRYDFTLGDGAEFQLPTGIDVGEEMLQTVYIKEKTPVKVAGSERKAITFCEKVELPEPPEQPEPTGLGQSVQSEEGETLVEYREVYPGSVIEGIGPDRDGDLVVFGPPYSTSLSNNVNGPGQGSFLNYVADSEGKVIYGSRLAQGNEDPHSILAPGKMWKWEFISLTSEPERSTVTATVEDKQLYIGNRPARRVSVVSDAGMFEPFTVVLSESRGLLEFYWSDNLSGTYAYFTPVMDFSLVKGEAVYAEEGGSDWLVGRVSSVFNETVCGIDRKYQRIESQNTDRSFVWVDGVGAQYTDEYMTIFPQADCGNSFGGMLECYENGVCVFKAEDFARGQNSVEGVFDSETETVKSGATYDLMGRRVERVLPGSVYVRDGKKFVGK